MLFNLFTSLVLSMATVDIGLTLGEPSKQPESVSSEAMGPKRRPPKGFSAQVQNTL